MNKQIVRRFREFAQANGISLDLEEVEFELVNLVNDSNGRILFNPSKDRVKVNALIEKKEKVSKIPMDSVDELFGQLKTEIEEEFIEKLDAASYKYFEEGDVLWAKVTPCMENGNCAIAVNLKNGLGYGSTEFHVFRAKKDEVNSKYLWYFLRNKDFRELAKPTMTGSGGLKRVPKSFLESQYLPIPKPSQGLSSFQIQEILVRFIEHGQAEHQRQLDKCAALRPILDKMERAVVPRVLEKSRGAKKKMREFLQEKGIELNYENLEFETLRVHSDNPKELVCSKRMGFTPTRDPEGNVNWFTVSDLNSEKGLFIDNPQTKEKTTIEKVKEAVGEKSIKFKSIEKGDVLVSFKLTVGVTKIYDSDELAYCNEAIDILTPNERVTSEYLAINCMVEYPKYGSITNNGKTLNDDHKKEIEVKVPRDLGIFSSIEIQKILVEFIFKYLKTVNWNRSVADRLEAGVARYREAHLKLFFESLKQKAHAD